MACVPEVTLDAYPEKTPSITKNFISPAELKLITLLPHHSLRMCTGLVLDWYVNLVEILAVGSCFCSISITEATILRQRTRQFECLLHHMTILTDTHSLIRMLHLT